MDILVHIKFNKTVDKRSTIEYNIPIVKVALNKNLVQLREGK